MRFVSSLGCCQCSQVPSDVDGDGDENEHLVLDRMVVCLVQP